MPIKINSLDEWVQTRNALAQNLSSALEFETQQDFSTDPASDFQKSKQQRDRILDELKRLAVAGVQMIDDQIAAGTLVQQIKDLTKDAVDEAEKLKNATKTIDKITKAVDVATGVVTKITRLPFL
ncbi:MAG TPA: hypothetical protein VGD66_12805 [Allosphingosinicella sp.]|jgi:hypothetical protein